MLGCRVPSFEERTIIIREATRLNNFVRRWRWAVLRRSLQNVQSQVAATEPRPPRAKPRGTSPPVNSDQPK